ncbi:MAG TPA: DUF4178 domain-containing protein [Enhygromyxa sp.]|nr:DUF4178 domain-containing protein [Enhygromyxa sp.]
MSHAAATPAPPIKLFREEAKTGAIECPACGAPITLRSFGGLEQVACSYCGTICKPESDGNLDILQRAERQRRSSTLPLHQRGTIDGVTWEIIGITWREVVHDHIAYPWQEFLLFNPYEGYRWLIYSMTDGVWSFGGALPGAPEAKGGAQPSIAYKGQEYKHFTGGQAQTTYVEGEFPWQVREGDVASTNDFICPPMLISTELQHTQHGADLNFTQMRPIEAREVWAAFAQPGSPPPTVGIHPAALNPHTTKFFWVAGIVLFAIWVVALIVYASSREREVVFQGRVLPGEPLTHELEIGEHGKPSTLALEVQAAGMNNSWAYAEVLLVDVETEEALAVGLEVDYYSGVDGGESWSEGSSSKREVVGGVPGGKYILQVTPQFDASGDPADYLHLTITRDVPLGRYMFLPLLVIVAFPGVNLARRAIFETKRWATSDYAATGSEE